MQVLNQEEIHPPRTTFERNLFPCEGEPPNVARASVAGAWQVNPFLMPLQAVG